ncbi:hypothetical protein LPB72_03355 [Hydrogenophaga crassostreae]|uniref:YtkA-like domain-containing protein n=1 Tax=Hydrogenophaga crassostreae TaxID=1763535 RepID=A0A162Z477_9BURK|nr:hypothetical protein [Hydrogenophaga crassostreae]AOW14392.1 hypothetical protein LPB072_17680 [Hydrogenophaga crassostreae]OAD43583.1 hypothetical protein LPB72_03355 [Hydrogenophaga crassostreae]
MKARCWLPRCAVALTLLSAAWAAQAECPIPDSLSSAGPVQARWVTDPAAVQVGEPFVLMLELCPAAAQLEGVDASMPDHRHGMNYKPSFKPLGEGLWRVDGMLWHMAGRWELKLDTRLDGAAHRLTPSVILK